ncbi:MAG: molybdopterin-dependent oxidoreductase [Acidimicrobiales bacterium]
MTDETLAYRTCPLCEATCGLEIQVVDGSIGRIRGDRDDVFSRGFICPKGTTLGRFHDDPDRLRRPLIRVDGEHVEVSWEEAFSAVAERLLPVLEQHGRDHSAIYLGNPVVHSLDSLLYSRAVTQGLGTPNVYSASTVDQRPREVASGLIYGYSLTVPVPDIDRSDFLVLLGANPYVSNGSLATAPDWPGRLDSLVDRGGHLVVIDPVRTRTAEAATTHLAIRPTTDALLLAAIATELVARGHARPDPADADTLDVVAAQLLPFTAASVADRVGVREEQIGELVESLASAKRPCVYGRIGTTVTPFGTTASWLTDVVNALLGALDAPGGAMFPMNPAGSRNTRTTDPFGPARSLGRKSTAVSGLPVELGEQPVSALAEEVAAGNVRAMVTVAGNPVLSCPDGRTLDEALASLDVMISVDCYLNETTRHADVILPPPSHVQKSHFDVAFASLAVRNVANYSAAILPLDSDQLPEWEVLARLASVAGGGPADESAAAFVDDLIYEQTRKGVLDSEAAPADLTEGVIDEAVGKRRGPDRILDTMLRSGPWGDWFGRGDASGLSVDRLVDEPHGIDMGALEPRLPAALATPSGRPEFAHPDLIADIPRLEGHLSEPESNGHLELVNRRTLRSNNSWMHNLEVLVKGRPRCTLQIHPDDADLRGLRSGDPARVQSVAGEVVIPVEITDSIRPGVVSIPHGWGHGREGTRMGVAAEHAGVNVNVLTPSTVVDPLSGTSQLTGIAVEVAPA